MKMDPTTYRPVHCNLYLTERQKILLKELAKEWESPMSELAGQAVHFFLKKHGRSDGIPYSKDEFYSEYLRGCEEMKKDALRREKERKMARDAALRIDREKQLEMERERERERERQRAKEEEIEERFRKDDPEKNGASE